MWGGPEGWGWGFWIFHNFLWWVILILGIVVLVRLLGGSRRSAEPPSETALDILKKRYARGEINKDEFEQKKRDISG
jgi:putative membrane protein